MTEIGDFILARLKDEEELYKLTSEMHTAIKNIVAWHENWPVIVEREIESEPPIEFDHLDVNSIVYKMHREMMIGTEKAYIAKFGIDPPTAPIMRFLAEIWEWHADYKEEWRP